MPRGATPGRNLGKEVAQGYAAAWRCTLRTMDPDGVVRLVGAILRGTPSLPGAACIGPRRAVRRDLRPAEPAWGRRAPRPAARRCRCTLPAVLYVFCGDRSVGDPGACPHCWFGGLLRGWQTPFYYVKQSGDVGVKRLMVDSNGVAPSKALHSVRKILSVGHHSAIDEHGNDAYLAFEGSLDFQNYDVLRIIEPTSSPRIGDR